MAYSKGEWLKGLQNDSIKRYDVYTFFIYTHLYISNTKYTGFTRFLNIDLCTSHAYLDKQLVNSPHLSGFFFAIHREKNRENFEYLCSHFDYIRALLVVSNKRKCIVQSIVVGT